MRLLYYAVISMFFVYIYGVQAYANSVCPHGSECEYYYVAITEKHLCITDKEAYYGEEFPHYCGYIIFIDKNKIKFVKKTDKPIRWITRIFDDIEKFGYLDTAMIYDLRIRMSKIYTEDKAYVKPDSNHFWRDLARALDRCSAVIFARAMPGADPDTFMPKFRRYSIYYEGKDPLDSMDIFDVYDDFIPTDEAEEYWTLDSRWGGAP